MTTEDDFQKALDANPDDWQTRLVFADFLQERGDPRAEGYRALGQLRVAPRQHDYSASSEPDARHWRWAYWWDTNPDWARQRAEQKSDYGHVLSQDWVALASGTGRGKDIGGVLRRECEAAAALAFSKLPPERRTELLSAAPSESLARKKPRKPAARKPKAKRRKK